ncbi:unnamed protein product [Didymodactylos carnosus]|uniref:Uncharacterized protein n=1 Tax=Didymodactylos carnosus TaxID=1234261 RepID=A0A813U6Q1_9BILA|nr:unnamed protein product [Didymodactylos carnosus]CAF0905906.1 unnamed protein product [Didymodactylos carnosus]CAF3608373.1 unnamed protein product [Didymodactylos carnosus]CAF3685828.1 unnamed protein product [Didymodactylos carnosus]
MARVQPDAQFKILLIGDSGVGKTCLMFRFADNMFAETFTPTIGIDFKIKTVRVRDKTIKLQLWDTAGQEKFYNITRSYYRNADAILLVYDRTEAVTFQNIARWMRNIDENVSYPDDVIRILVGNKSDLQNRLLITSNEGKALADKYHVDFFETSAKSESSPNVNKMFYYLTEKLLDRRTNESSNLNEQSDLTERTSSINIGTLAYRQLVGNTCCSTRTNDN